MKKVENSFLKPFKVVTVSSNTNSFGLRGMVLMAEDGEAWEVGVSNIYEKSKNATIYLPVVDGKTEVPCGHFQCEIPRQLPKAPKNVIQEVWNNT